MSVIPGNWEVRSGGNLGPTYVYSIDKDGEEYVVAKCWGFEDKGNETALLVAAAPELLAALKVADMALDFAQAQVDSERDANQLRGWRREIQKAIAKAEGRGEE
jgi:hypothetical protein